MSHSQNSMGYMVVLCIILYIVGVSIYLFVKFVRKKLDEARDRRFQREHQGSPMSEMKTYCSLHQIELGILTVPAAAAQEATDEMIKSGIRAVWCFSRSQLQVPEGVTVQYEDLALSLAHLQNKIK